MPLTAEAVRALGDVRLMHRMWVAGWAIDPSLLPFRVMERAMAEALLSGEDSMDIRGWFNRHTNSPGIRQFENMPNVPCSVDPDKVRID